MTIDIQNAAERLATMRAKAKHAEDAYALLYRLTILRTLFSRALVKKFAPRGMPRPVRRAAFSTLRQWRMVRREAHDTYIIDPEILEIVAPAFSEDLLARQFECSSAYRYSAFLSVSTWAEARAVILWGMSRDSIQAIKLLLSTGYRFSWDDEMVDIAVKAAYQIEDPQQKWNLVLGLGFHGKWQSPPATFYPLARQALEQQVILMGQKEDLSQTWMLYHLGNLALKHGEYALARDCYERQLAFWERDTRWHNHIDLLNRLNETAIKQNDLVSAHRYFQRAVECIHWSFQSGGWSERFINAGLIVHRTGEHETARLLYVQAVLWSQGRNQTENHKAALWAWGQMEYDLGHTDVGYQMCLTAILSLERAADLEYETFTPRSRTAARQYWAEADKMRQTLIAPCAQHDTNTAKSLR